ncbi:bifunctional 2-polyprenyl-6-hydroxyphenol methylase/3-demethylubiquinol 3-O-methyltransferase UbiG [Micromonospora sp. HM5-17]|uniref:class I SAM-dependent methyltransferase n=1 Tax=Micromonospora sp. HM5-17 TaxID=2487710 RepID=UPI001F311E5B|nr:methyltransferase [Micromonospora sp. HM5-17]
MSARSDARAPATLEEATVLQSEVLEDLRTAVNYTRWLTSLTEPWLGDDPLEIGSGLGDAAALWAAGGRTVTASEADPGRLAQLTERFAGHPRVRVRELTVPIRETANYSAVVALNVLEHIEDDVAALRAFGRLVRPGGRIVLVVPAFEQAMSRFDREIGHFRRYRVKSMDAALRAAGLRPLRVHYVNSIGLLGWLLLVKALGGKPREGIPLRIYDRLCVPVLRRVERRIPVPFGQSVFAVAETPG